ncbi:hypothetical protein HRbin35_00466 [bacterium HR35]|nr:hypothetical protein HRbin35_00466 [bacterium HR35]
MNLNLEEIKNKILTDVKYQIIILIIVLLVFAYILFKPNKPKRQTPCYNLHLKVWANFDKDKFLSFISPFSSKYCLYFDYYKKDFDNLEKDFIYALAGGEAPDLIYAPNYIIYRNKKYLQEINLNLPKPLFLETEIENLGVPVNIDSLTFIYNKRIFDFFNYQPPTTISELNNLLADFKNKNIKDFYLIALGTNEVKNKKEIILVLKTLEKKSLDQTINDYYNYSDEKSPNFALKRGLGSQDISLFANEKVGAFIGFYEDLKSVLRLNPRISYRVSQNPLETFPPTGKNFVKAFYFAIPKNSSNYEKTILFLKWLLEEKNYEKFIEEMDLIPIFKVSSIEPPKDIFQKNAEYGSSYLDFISLDDYSQFEKVLEVWENNPNEGRRALELLNLRF